MWSNPEAQALTPQNPHITLVFVTKRVVCMATVVFGQKLLPLVFGFDHICFILRPSGVRARRRLIRDRGCDFLNVFVLF